ncbi:transglutaminase family protein [Candidatus Entotheonella palauensis]|nr:transglutaminase family protein [Candidatus Entotheonella palauensis]
MRRLHIHHATTYTYSHVVDLLPHTVRVRPREGHDVRIESSRLETTPASMVQWHRDVYDNSVAMVTFLDPTTELSIHGEVIIQHYDEQPLNFLVAEPAVNFPFLYEPAERVDLLPYTIAAFPEDNMPLDKWLRHFWHPGEVVETYVLLDRINKAIAHNLAYMRREEPGVQSPATTLAHHSGSCRDFATLFMEACRYIGLASRFVSGYVYGAATEIGPGATHAWCEVFLPGTGWKGFDSTRGEVVGSQHIAVAVHRHPEAVPPVAGAFVGQLAHAPTMTVNVQVRELS